MQSELSRLEEQLGRALEGEAWHGPSVLETLEGVSAEQAAAHPIAGAHSIWELVLHTAYTQLIGITQHNLYHAGQIAILKKALGSDGTLRSS